MKCETKAKRRLTLSLCGLGMLDESEVEVPPTAVTATEVVSGTVSTTLPPIAGHIPATEGGGTASMLFPTPDADRIGLIQRARIGMARLNKQKVGKLKEVWLGDAGADLEKVDLAALVSFVRDVEEAQL